MVGKTVQRVVSSWPGAIILFSDDTAIGLRATRDDDDLAVEVDESPFGAVDKFNLGIISHAQFESETMAERAEQSASARECRRLAYDELRLEFGGNP